MEYKFEIALQVLNHLGRGLYRNFATVVAEAISNSWDAEATEVHITIDKSKNRMVIKDNGKGMNSKDFQRKFLNIGYSRREDKTNQSNRKILGRKGIGKLALLSVADKIIINTKKSKSKETGGIVNNSKLDKAIKGEKLVEQYRLDVLKGPNIFKKNENGTCITFEGINEAINNPDLIKKYLALIFNFAIGSPKEKFDMYINGEIIDNECLKELYKNTQYLWSIGKLEAEVPKALQNIGFEDENKLKGKEKRTKKVKKELDRVFFPPDSEKHMMRGYIASVDKPRNLRIPGSEGTFRAKLNLFVNGRLRHEDILADLPSGQTSQIPASYLYGEIHVDSFDNTKKKNEDDLFTSNRESVIGDDPRYKIFLEELSKVIQQVLIDWNSWRKKTDPFIPPPDDFEDMTDEKKKLVKKLQNIDQGKDQSKQVERIFTEMRPKKRNRKRILICHASKDKKLANKVEEELLIRQIPSDKILYTSSKHRASRIPPKENIFDYIRDFFVQDWYKKPIVIFVLSSEMEKRWAPCLEAGAAWVISEKGVEQVLTMKSRYREKPPLNIGKRYIRFDAKGNFKDQDEAEDIFDYVKSMV